jgi:antitoxin (DNA-binding transcriptional repressor) of toxin-antitoxin stability system
MARTIGVTEFQAHMGKILKAIRGGEQIAIFRRGKVVAFLVPL